LKEETGDRIQNTGEKQKARRLETGYRIQERSQETGFQEYS